jgi:hypothetical protein
VKKILLVVMALAIGFLFTVVDASAQGGGKLNPKVGFTIKAGIDMMGESDSEFDYGAGTDTSSGGVNTGISVSAEYIFGINDMVGIGPGITYQFPRGIDEDYPEGKFQFIPIYALFSFCIPTKRSDLSPFVVFHIGYNLFLGDDDFEESYGDDVTFEGGLYWGLGGGIRLQNGLQLEILYSVNKGYAKDIFVPGLGEGDGEAEYSKVTFSVGYNF